MTRTRTIAVSVVLALAGAAVAVWMMRGAGSLSLNQGGGGSETAAPSALRPPSLGARLTLVTGAPGDDAALIMRVYNARARQAAVIREATAGGRPWTGSPILDGDLVVTVRLGRGEWIERTAVEVLHEGGVPTRIDSTALTIVEAPDTDDLTLDASSTYEVVMALAAADVPSPGTRLHLTLDIGDERVTTNGVTVVAPTAGAAAPLVQRARAALALGRYMAVADAATALVEAAPDDARGYWYRGIALEATDDRDAALVAYRAAASRIEGGQEPPAGLFARIARLEAGAPER